MPADHGEKAGQDLSEDYVCWVLGIAPDPDKPSRLSMRYLTEGIPDTIRNEMNEWGLPDWVSGESYLEARGMALRGEIEPWDIPLRAIEIEEASDFMGGLFGPDRTFSGAAPFYWTRKARAERKARRKRW